MNKVDGGIVLFDTMYIGSGEVPHGLDFVLRLQQGEDMVYHNHDLTVIDYPGEYEIGGYLIFAFTTKKDTALHYIIRFGNKKVAYLQNEKALDHDEITDMTTRYITEAGMEDAISRRELWGEVVFVG